MKSYKISYYVLYALFAAIIAVILLFFMGGDAQSEALITTVDPGVWQPAQTDTLLYLIYGLGALAIIVTLVGVLAQFGMAFKESPINALKSLSGILVLVAIFVISWAMGSDQVLNIVGYEGTHNVPFWLKMSDMLIFSIYILTAGCLLAMLFGAIKKKLS